MGESDFFLGSIVCSKYRNINPRSRNPKKHFDFSMMSHRDRYVDSSPFANSPLKSPLEVEAPK